MIVEEQARADHPRGPQMRLVRQDELQRRDDVRRGAKKHFALRQRLGDEAEFVVFEIAQAAVDQLGAPRRRMRRQIVFFDQQYLQAASRRVARDARAVDAAADDGKIECRWIGRWHRSRSLARILP